MGLNAGSKMSSDGVMEAFCAGNGCEIVAIVRFTAGIYHFASLMLVGDELMLAVTGHLELIIHTFPSPAHGIPRAGLVTPAP